ncbi:hypothetical protein CNR22_08810 [Sphingobacteriaceae bacterium]|nr:hypothetical protein CNR22_08810 [Sphingobacteriaceae bacterium]
MSRFKTIAFWIFVVLALGTGIYAYFNLKNNKKPQLEALSVIPDECLFYLNTKDFFELNKKVNSQSLIADKLKLFGEVDLICTSLASFDSLCTADEDIQEIIKDNIIHLAGYKEKNGWLAAFNIKQFGKQDAIAGHLAGILKATKSKANIYSFKLNALLLYFNLNEGVATISNRQELIIYSLDSKRKKLHTNPDFVQFKNTLDETSLLTIYLDHARYAESNSASHLNLAYACKKGYSAGAIDFQPSQIKVNGYIEPGEDELLALFREQKPQNTADALALLPQNSRFFKAFGFSSYQDLKDGFPLTRVHIKYWMKANERGLYNVENDFNSNLINHIVEFETNYPQAKFISVQVNDTLKALENLKFMSDSVLKKDSLVVFRLNDSIDNPLRLFVALSTNNTNYAVVYQSHIFFADKSEELFQLIKDLKNGNLLSANESFAGYKNQNFPEDFNYLLYTSPNQMPEEIPAFFNFTTTSGENPFSNFKHFSFSVNGNAKTLKFRLHLMNEPENHSKEQNVLWTLNLDASSGAPASGFVNHITGENEIVVQDDNNVLYLVNAKGTVLWKKQLSEKILSMIYTVDIYKKNKFQLLFNTRNYLHLIDRNGNYVEQYPVKLPAEASAPLSLFDYDNNKDYRLFIACKNSNIYNYSIHGMPQDKFATVKTDDEVTLPVQYVKVGASDYLVALDKEGKIYTFSRKGAGRIGLRNRAISNCTAFYVDPGNSVSSTFLVYLDDKSGLLNKISFEDKKEIVRLHSDLENADIRFSLVDENRSMDLLITKNNFVQAYNFSGNLIVEKSSEAPLGKSGFYSDESHSIFYTLYEDKTALTIFDQVNSTKKTVKATALPLVSNLFKDNKKYLIVTNGNQLSCVLLN